VTAPTHVDGGTGSDTVDYGAAVTVDLAEGTSSGQGDDTLTAIENVSGSHQHDTIFGDDGPNRLTDDGGGDDEIRGAGGDDYLRGGSGQDLLDGGDGTDTCIGGETVESCESTDPPEP
jgi:Ca2+-binding RTX toxin-like protein